MLILNSGFLRRPQNLPVALKFAKVTFAKETFDSLDARKFKTELLSKFQINLGNFVKVLRPSLKTWTL